MAEPIARLWNKRRPAAPAAFFLVCAFLVAPGLAPAAEIYQPPRHSDGHPDLEGDWTNSSLTTLERPIGYGEHRALSEQEVEALEADFTGFFVPQLADGPVTTFDLGQGGDFDAYTTVMRVGGEPRTSFITLPANGRVPDSRPGAPLVSIPPLTDEQMASNPETQPPPVRCLPNMTVNSAPVMLPGGYNNNYRIVQSPDAVVIFIQMADTPRIIRLGGKHRTDGIRPWMGDSIGHWDKDSLVVETTNFPQTQAFHGAWEHLKVTEIFSRTAKDRLLYRFTVEDPTVWDKPWGGEYEFAERDKPFDEYACHEHDYTIQFTLEAARYEDAHPPAPKP